MEETIMVADTKTTENSISEKLGKVIFYLLKENYIT